VDGTGFLQIVELLEPFRIVRLNLLGKIGNLVNAFGLLQDIEVLQDQ
jgi:hypothetical protein